MKRLMIVRHGESEWNASRKLQGQADIDLSERGRQQARALRTTVEALNPDASITSDLKRAVETAKLLGIKTPLPNPALREIDVGAWTGRPIADIRDENAVGYQGWRSGTFTPDGGEHWNDFVSRTSACVMDALNTSERLLVVCHGGVIRALLERLVDLSPRCIIPVGPASLTVLAERPADSGSMRLELFNYSPLGPVLDAPD
ncbi:histidine phosphatase family protein [uncultured Nitratireductor sp.]|uniref:histidine phosphatase family protein n=1 Tax=uncultured Nitratireductor sp. TaxID=520953 RepID=UPI0025FA7DFD|nr:histidine phosphatase family protein [uncultured Nitratireductor sp.]